MIQVKVFTFSPFQTNTYIIFNHDSSSAIIIDSSNYFDKENYEIENFVKSSKLKIEAVILTHGHLDHIFGLNFLYNNVCNKIMINQNDLFFITKFKEYSELFGLRVSKINCDFDLLNDKDKIELGDFTLEILHTPGHSPGSICVKLANEKIIFTGDTLFENSIGRSDLEGGNEKELINSIKEKLLTIEEFWTIYPGHGNTSTIGQEKRFNPFLKS